MTVLVRALVVLVETLFFLGLVGAAVVVVLSFIEDLQELFTSDEEPVAPHAHR